MKISVIIPAFNRRHLIGSALLSVRRQTMKPHEVIVVDDGSTDGLEHYIRASFPDVRYVAQSNQGPSAARNTGIQCATGTHIALMDSDDKWPACWIDRQMELHAANPELDVSFGREAKFSEGEQLVEVDDGYSVPTGRLYYAFDFIAGGLNIPTSGVLARRESLLAVGCFDPALRLCEDKDLWIKLALYGCRFGFINEILSYRRMHEGNLVNQRLRIKECAAEVLERHQDQAECMYGIHYTLRARLSSLHYDIGSAYLKQFRWSEAKAHLSKALCETGRNRMLVALKRGIVCLVELWTPQMMAVREESK